MSLTSQLKLKSSSVRRFLDAHDNREGRLDCISKLRSLTAPVVPSAKPKSPAYYGLVGTVVDHLIRYELGARVLDFESTAAFKLLKSGRGQRGFWVSGLWDIGREYLDGRPGGSREAIYSATALAIVENYYRSGFWPALFAESDQRYEAEQVERLELAGLIGRVRKAKFRHCAYEEGENFSGQKKIRLSSREMLALGVSCPPNGKVKLISLGDVEACLADVIHKIPVAELLNNFCSEKLGMDLYISDVSRLMEMFCRKMKHYEELGMGLSLLSGARSLFNSRLVGGADIDCVVSHGARVVLVDVKSGINQISVEQFWQLLCYALLLDEEKDGFVPSDVGIYDVRRDDFLFLSIDEIVRRSLRGFGSIEEAREKFQSWLRNKRFH